MSDSDKENGELGPTNHVEQKENILYGGDLAGRDIYKPVYNLQLASKPTYMSKLIERFKEEKEQNIVFRAMVDKLEHYGKQVDGDEVAGLDAKLASGRYAGFLQFAKESKEQFSKKLEKYVHYESAQKIFAYILAGIYVRFTYHISPLIENGESKERVLAAVRENIITPIQKETEENVLELLADEINGALFYLTGNCHIRWV